MLNNLFSGIFSSTVSSEISVPQFLLCIAVSLVIGAVLTLVYIYKTKYTKSFAITLAILPAVVCVIIMMVNGNLGAGVAVAGAFSLVRFRSAPGSAKEIGTIFIATGAGLMTGMGYLAYAALFTVILGAVMLAATAVAGSALARKNASRVLRITIPENLDYNGIFDDVLSKYTVKNELLEVKTANMGSLYKLKYDVVLKNANSEKAFADELRCRNGNLEISISKAEESNYAL